MAILKIVTKEDEILRKKSKPVDVINDRIITLLDDMKDTLIKTGGVGLAAVQVGILRRIFIIDTSPEEDKHNIIEFINPEIIDKKGNQKEIEGCLSIPGEYGLTSRPMTVTVKATDRNGKEFTYTGSELYGRCLCHEYDHLDGILYIDHALEMYEDD
jgi:peptide deformylase